MAEDLQQIAAAARDWHAQLVAQEKLVRQAALFGFPERVGGFKLVPLTLAKWTALAIMDSPYLPPGRVPTEGETLALLWLLSPHHVPESHPEVRARRRQFFRQNFAFRAPLPPLFQFTRRARARHRWRVEQARQEHEYLTIQIRNYIAEALQDAPSAGSEEGVPRTEYYCDAVATASVLARAFGGGVEKYFEMPLKLVFQLVKANSEFEQASANVPVVLHNSSDAAAALELEAVNRALHESGVKLHPDAVSWFAKHNSQN